MKEQQPYSFLKRADTICAKRGVRLTEQRKLVLDIVLNSKKPLSAYEILDMMRTKVKNPAPPTVYRALDFLLDHGLIHKLETLHAYVGCNHPEHSHASQFLICSDCGEVCEFEDKNITNSLFNAVNEAGFITQKPVIELLGTCAQCHDKQ